MTASKQSIAESIVTRLKQNGYEAYFAGGCVRDRLLGGHPNDFDIATSCTPDQVETLFEKTVPVGAKFGVMIVVEQGHGFEIATFRTEGGYQDGRRPSFVKFASVQEDANRRDFTVNGLYLDVAKDEVLDFVGGQSDIEAKCIRTIGDPEERFLEDHLRLMRAIRFAVQLGFEIEGRTFDAVKKHASKIVSVSAERIRDELIKTLTSADPERGIRLLDETGLLIHILPEMEVMKGVEQPKEYHPEGDVYVHTLLLLKQLSRPSIELAMGALLHDVAKPATYEEAADRIRFHGHDKLGGEMSVEICRRLCFSNNQTKLIKELVDEHLRFKDAMKMRESKLKRFVGMDRFDLHLELHRIDCLASHGNLEAYDFCKKAYEDFLNAPPPPLRLIKGQDLIELGFKPGPQFSQILLDVEDQILEGAIKGREDAIQYVKEHYPKCQQMTASPKNG